MNKITCDKSTKAHRARAWERGGEVCPRMRFPGRTLICSVTVWPVWKETETEIKHEDKKKAWLGETKALE